MFFSQKKIILSIFAVFLMVLPADAGKHQQTEDGVGFYAEERYEDAVKAFNDLLSANPENPLLNYNSGTAEYKNGNYSAAVDKLQKALLSDDAQLKNKSAFNLGNALFRHGMQQAGEDIDFAIKTLEKAIDQYDNILTRKPGFTDAETNRRIVQRELDKLKQQKQQQQQQQSQDQKSDQNKEKDERSENDQQQQDQQQSGQSDQQDSQDPSSGQDESDNGSEQNDKNDRDPSLDNAHDQNNPGSSDSGRQQDLEDQDRQDRGNQDSGDIEEKPEEDGRDGQAERDRPQSRPDNGNQMQAVRPGELTTQEAERMLNQYIQREQPKGLLNFYKYDGDTSPVYEDW